MAMKNKSKNIPLLFICGVMLLAYGFGTYYVKQYVTQLAAVCVFIGMADVLICFLRIKGLSPKSASSSRFRRIALFTGLVVLWIVLYIEVNYLAYHNSYRWDVTAAKQHTLTDNTKDLIGDLYQEIRMTVFYTGLSPKYLEDLLSEYERLSDGKITTEIIDPIVRISYAAQFGSTISSKKQKVFVRSGDEKREIDFTDGVLTEEQLTNAIVRVTRIVRRVYFLTGHNEYDIYEEGDEGLKAFEMLLATNHVISKRVMLGIEDDIPEDCDVLVIAGPKNHLTAEEEKTINAYLRNGGDALFLIENVIVTTPDKPLTKDELSKNPSLNAILNNWGINIADDIVVDLSSHASGDVGSPATNNYLAHRSIVGDLDYTFFVRPRSISIRKGRRYSIKLAPIILTVSKKESWGETNRTLDIKFDAGVDRAGPVPIAFAIWEKKEEGDASDTRIIVITDADFLTNAYIGQYSNARLGINAINWLSEVDYKVMFDKKHINVQKLYLTSQQKRTVGVMLFLIPLLIATAGIMVWMRRRLS